MSFRIYLKFSLVFLTPILFEPVSGQTLLKELSKQLDASWKSERAHAESLATILRMPIREDRPDGRTIELQGFEKGMPRYYATQNLNAARTISTVNVWSTGGLGYFLSGSGMTLGEWDAGQVLATHQELAGRVTSTQGALHFHSTHVAGTMIAAGISGSRKGMSYAAQLDAFDWNSDASEMASEAASGLRVSNHSYGLITGWDFDFFGDGKWAWFGDPAVSAVEDYRFGFYDANAATWDNVAEMAPYYLIAKSAGNDRNEGPGSGASVNHWVFVGGAWVLQTVTRNQDGNSGYDCIEGGGVAKNVLTVGAVDDLISGYINAPGVTMSSFSCWGPTDDGRIKPDIVANGVNLSSTLETANNAYGSLSGTSMATPNASGSVGLLLEYYNSLHGNTLIRSSTMKGLIIHTADEAGTSAGPDYRFGWGLMNTYKAAQLMTADSADGFGSHMREILVTNHDTIRVLVGSNGLQPLRATLCWTDPAASVSGATLDPTTLKLINDFDLRIIKRIDQTVSSPWILNPASPALAATTGDNTRDNVEQVLVSSPVQANYVVQITHKGTLASARTVSLLLSGNIEPLGSSMAVADDSLNLTIPPGSVRIDSLMITNSSDSTLQYHVTVPPPESGWLSPSDGDSGSVPPSNSVYFRFTVDASLLSQWSSYEGTLDFTSNDEEHPAIAVHVGLETQGPDLSLTPATVIVDVDSGITGTGEITLLNIGTNALHFLASDTGASLPPWLALSADSGTIAPSDTAEITVTAGDSLLPKGDYATMLAIATNDSVNGTQYVHVELHVGTRHLFSVSIASQWNLISLPVLPVTLLKHDHYPTAISSAFFYQGSYAAKETLKFGQGFWLKFGGAATFNIDGYTVTDDTVALNAGWNIVGSISVPVPVVTMASIPGGIVTSRFYGYNGAYFSADTLFPGGGYWVKSNQAGQLLLTASGGASPSSAIHIMPTRELPPSPPEGNSQGEVSLPVMFALDQNFPNPFNPTTIITYQLPERSYLSLKVYNILGSEVATLIDGTMDAGYMSVEWDGRSMGSIHELSSGVYFYKLTAGNFVATRKMILIR